MKSERERQGDEGELSMKSIIFVTALVLVAVSYNNCGKYNFSNTPSDGTAVPDAVTGPPGTPVSFTNTNCTIGYPYTSANPITSAVFSESEVLAAYNSTSNTISVWYNDEHAMILGVRRVIVKDAAGATTTTDYPVSPLTANPGVFGNPQVGATALLGDQAGVDINTCSGAPDNCSRPMYPAIFITDTTASATSTSGDWQFGGTAIPPHTVYGTWKAAVRTLDKSVNPPKASVTVDADPAMNNWNLGVGIPAPSSANLGWGSLSSWDVGRLGLLPGHSYRLQFMVHDGDQNKAGGDVGENCVNIQM
jgi:hypothetical protein